MPDAPNALGDLLLLRGCFYAARVRTFGIGFEVATPKVIEPFNICGAPCLYSTGTGGALAYLGEASDLFDWLPIASLWKLGVKLLLFSLALCVWVVDLLAVGRVCWT